MIVKSTIDFDAVNLDLMEQIEPLSRNKWGRKAVKQAANVAARHIKRVIPESSKTGTRRKWSKTTAKSRVGKKSAKKSTKAYLHKKKPMARVWTPTMAFLVAPKRKAFYWGTRGPIVRGTTAIKRAVKRSLNEQQRAIEETLKKGLASIG